MSELSAIVATPDTTTLPGHTLNRFRLRDFAQCEEEFSARHLKNATIAGRELDPKESADLRSLAMSDVARGYFNYGRPGFAEMCFASRCIPFVTWVCLKIGDSKITLPEVESLITEENEAIVHRAVLKAMRFADEKKVISLEAADDQTLGKLIEAAAITPKWEAIKQPADRGKLLMKLLMNLSAAKSGDGSASPESKTS